MVRGYTKCANLQNNLRKFAAFALVYCVHTPPGLAGDSGAMCAAAKQAGDAAVSKKDLKSREDLLELPLAEMNVFVSNHLDIPLRTFFPDVSRFVVFWAI